MMTRAEPPLRSRPISLRRAIWFLATLRLRRSINLYRSQLKSRVKKGAGRTATPGKAGSGWFIPSVFGMFMLLSGFMYSFVIIDRLKERVSVHELPGTLGGFLCLMTITLVVLGLGISNKELSRLDSDMEWLQTLPASLPTLLVMKVVERTITNFFGWFSVVPFVTVLLWQAELGWLTPFLSLALTVPLLGLVATLQVLAESSARAFFPALLIRNTQAFATILGITLGFLVLSPGLAVGETDFFFWDWLRPAGQLDWIPFSQPAVIAATLGAGDWGFAVHLCLWIVEVVFLFALCWTLMRKVYAHGAIVGAAVLVGVRGPHEEPSQKMSLLSGVVGKDLRLLARDRTFMVNALVVPGAFFGFQVLFNPELLESASGDPTQLSVMAFLFGAYMLGMSATTILAREGPALWLLFTLPEALERQLLKKALMWAPFALCYTSIVLLYGIDRLGLSSELVTGGVYAVLGLPIYALIGGALGVFGADPLAYEAKKRVRADYFQMFMLLQGAYVFGFYDPTHWAKVPIFVLIGAIALALWQGVRGRLPYLLDPGSHPPPSVSLSDGLIAALFFFVAQGLLALGIAWLFELPPWTSTTLSFAGSGFVVVSGVLCHYRQQKLPEIWKSLGLGMPASWFATLKNGLLWAVPACLTAAGWTMLTEHLGWAPESEGFFEQTDAASTVLWFSLLVVVAAPIFEEILFRGVIYQGLRKSYSVFFSVVAGSLIFAVIHPSFSVVPVFVLAMCASMAFERSKSLLAPMLVHATYNGLLVALALGRL